MHHHPPTRDPSVLEAINELAVEVVGIQSPPTTVREREPAWIEPEPRRLNLLWRTRCRRSSLTVARSNSTVRLLAVD